MRYFAFGSALVLCAGFVSQATATEPNQLDQPNYAEPVIPWTDAKAFEDAVAKQNCKVVIERARAEAGLPESEDSSQTEKEPLLIKAVDRKIDNCSVLVMSNNPQDFRPLPPKQSEAKLQKIEN